MMQQPGFNPAMVVPPQLQQPTGPILPLPSHEDPNIDVAQTLSTLNSGERRNFVGNAIYGVIEEAFP